MTTDRSTWDDRDAETARHHRNAHLIELVGASWACSICRHYFDAAVDADLFACGDPCVHPRPPEESS